MKKFRTSDEMIRDGYREARAKPRRFIDVHWTRGGLLSIDEPGKHGHYALGRDQTNRFDASDIKLTSVGQTKAADAFIDKHFKGTLPMSPHGGDIKITGGASYEFDRTLTQARRLHPVPSQGDITFIPGEITADGWRKPWRIE